MSPVRNIKEDKPSSKISNGVKVLMVATTFPRWKDDSEPAFVYDIAKGIFQQGIEVIVLCPHTAGALKTENWDGIRIIRFPYFYPYGLERLCYRGGIPANFKNDFLAKIQMPLLFISEFIYLWRIVEKERMDIVHSHWLFPQGLVAAILKKIIKFKLVVTVHSGLISGKKSWIVKKLIKFIHSQADAITVNSRSNLKNLSEITGIDGVSKIPMGINTEEFSPFHRSQSLKKKLAGDGILLLTVARFAEVKGHEYLIKAMAEVVRQDGNIKLVLIGVGPLENRVKSLVRKYELNEKVIFLGEKPRHEIVKYFASSDIFILPSIICQGGDTEGFGLSLIEALSSGLPVIASNVGGITDIVIDGENGFLAREKDPVDLSQKILKLSREAGLRQRFGQSGLGYVKKNFSLDIVTQKFFNLYRKIL